MHTANTIVKTYGIIWAILLLLVLVTLGLAYVDLGPLNTPAALLIAVVKMFLIILYFMHIRWSTTLTWLFAGSGFIWLIIFIVLTLSDYITRPQP